MKPAFFVVYAAGIGLNITFTRAYATHAGPGMAAALDYCMRGVGGAAGAAGATRFRIRCCRRSRACAASSACATRCA